MVVVLVCLGDGRRSRWPRHRRAVFAEQSYMVTNVREMVVGIARWYVPRFGRPTAAHTLRSCEVGVVE